MPKLRIRGIAFDMYRTVADVGAVADTWRQVAPEGVLDQSDGRAVGLSGLEARPRGKELCRVGSGPGMTKRGERVYHASPTLRAIDQDGKWSVAEVKKASCAVGEEMVILPHDVQPGEVIGCHGVRQRVTYKFGAYALEKGE
jgi:hypothetical protein